MDVVQYQNMMKTLNDLIKYMRDIEDALKQIIDPTTDAAFKCVVKNTPLPVRDA